MASHTAREPLGPILGRTAETILREMVAAYRSARTYGDHALFELVDAQGEQRVAPCTIAWERPNRIRVEVLKGYLVCDGTSLYAQTPLFPGQVLEKPAPDRLSINDLYSDPWLAVTMGAYQATGEGSGTTGNSVSHARFFLPPQLVLLLAADPLKTLLRDGATATLLTPEYLDENPCDLVKIEHVVSESDGSAPQSGSTRAGPTGSGSQRAAILWIRREDNALLRIDYVVASGRLARIELHDARFDIDLGGEFGNPSLTFRMEAPSDSKHVRKLDPILSLAEDAPEPTPEERARLSGEETAFEAAFRAATQSGVFSIDWPLEEETPEFGARSVSE
ncbi:MAG TPA: hypothetical protein DEB39_15020 [Planctomycetaceae bacterium]|nr:hypothetical protein [Planctomycetaceae bacterium]